MPQSGTPFIFARQCSVGPRIPSPCHLSRRMRPLGSGEIKICIRIHLKVIILTCATSYIHPAISVPTPVQATCPRVSLQGSFFKVQERDYKDEHNKSASQSQRVLPSAKWMIQASANKRQNNTFCFLSLATYINSSS